MSGNEKIESDTDEETDGDANFPSRDSAVAEDEFAVESLVRSKKKSASGVVSGIALLVSCLALAAVGFQYFVGQRALNSDAENDADFNTLSASLQATRNALASLEESVATTDDDGTRRDGQIASIGRELSDRLRQLEALPSRLSAAEASLASVQGISTGARAAWLLAEAEYYMQIANAQLQLANNPTLAKTALAHADERILQLGDPRLTNIRQALSDELLSLEVSRTPDIAGITLTLASLADVVDSLPIRAGTIVSEENAGESESDLSGMDRALATIKKTLSDAITVRRSDEAMQPLIAPDALYFLRANVALQIQIARLALLRGEEDVFRQSLDDAVAWLAEYYDLNDSGVRSARESLREIRNNTLSVAAPDISRSLRLLRQFNALNSAVDTNTVDDTGQEQ